MQSFKPYYLATVNVATSGSSAAVALPIQARSGDVIKVVNSGTAAIFLRQGASGVAASTSLDMPQLSGSVETYSLDEGTTHIGVIGASGSTVYITMGKGL